MQDATEAIGSSGWVKVSACGVQCWLSCAILCQKH